MSNIEEEIAMEDIQEYIEKYSSDYDFETFKKDLSLLTSEMGDKLRKSAKEIYEIVKDCAESLKKLEEKLKQVPQTKKYNSIFSWGKIGWGFIEEIPIHPTYFTVVNSISDANEIMSKYITDEIIEKIIKDISKYYSSNQAFVEAMDCFYEGKYLSCILILYSFIDALFLTWQEFPEKGKRMLPGFCANYLKELSIIMNKKDDFPFHYAMYVVNLEATTTLFSNGKDFVDEKDIPNRNFISHGMNNRQVIKLDCVRVLSILKGLYEMKQDINSEHPIKFVKKGKHLEIVNKN